MRVIVLVIVLLIVGAIGFAGVSVWQGWQPVWGYFQMARGYSPAKTPEEALEKFNKAIKERDYYTASEYCAGDFGKQMQKASAAAKAVATAVDGVEHNADLEGVKPTNKTVLWLRRPKN